MAAETAAVTAAAMAAAEGETATRQMTTTSGRCGGRTARPPAAQHVRPPRLLQLGMRRLQRQGVLPRR